MTTASSHSHTQVKRVAVASFIGALLEWYDFFIFGTAAALVLGPLFYPHADPMSGTVAAFATFGVGFIARPIGGIIFGHFGDKIGRKSMLVTTLMIMGVGTLVIGLLPTYAQIGIAAPVLLVICRLAQGLGLGGEYAGAALMTIEHSPEGKKGFWASLPQAAASGGILLATAVFALVSMGGQSALLAWTWRIPFIISALLLIVGLVIRLKISESPVFKEAIAEREAEEKKPSIPLVTVLRKYPKNLILAFGARLGETVTSNIVNAFGIYYVTTQVKMPSTVGLNGMLIASVVGLVVVPMIGALSDRIGRKRIYLAGAILGIILAFPMFALFNTGQVWAIWLAFTLVYVLVPTTMFAVESAFFSEMFSTDVSYTGISLVYQLSAIAGGYVPTVATALLLLNGGSPWLVAWAFVGVCVVTAICVFFVTDVHRARLASAKTSSATEHLSPQN